MAGCCLALFSIEVDVGITGGSSLINSFTSVAVRDDVYVDFTSYKTL